MGPKALPLPAPVLGGLGGLVTLPHLVQCLPSGLSGRQEGGATLPPPRCTNSGSGALCPPARMSSKQGLAFMAAHGWCLGEKNTVSLSWVLFPPSVATLGERTALCCLGNLDFRATACQTPFPQTELRFQEESAAHSDSSSF